MEILTTFYLILAGLLTFFLVLPTINVFFSLLTIKKSKPPASNYQFDFGNIITAYRNVDIAKGLVQSLLKQSHQKHHIYLVADNCDLSNWDIKDDRLTVLYPEKPLNLKVKSIIHGVENFVRGHEFICIFDADNLAHPNFLTEINKFAQQGYTSIQGQRTAKNLDTLMSKADALGEFYKNYIDRFSPYLNGSSAVISGSGMAVETGLYKLYLNSPEIESGKHQWKRMLQEDKILQNFLLRKNERIAYAWDAICYDEKVTTGDAVETQRSRWLFSYFQNLPNSIGIIRRGLLGFSWNQLLFGLVTIAPPMFIMLFVAFILSIIGLIIYPIASLFLASAIVLFCVTILWTIYLSNAPKEVWQAIWGAPGFVWRQIRGLFKMSNPNKNFKHTEHTKNVSIEDLL